MGSQGFSSRTVMRLTQQCSGLCCELSGAVLSARQSRSHTGADTTTHCVPSSAWSRATEGSLRGAFELLLSRR